MFVVVLFAMPTVERLERYDVNLRYSRDFRANLGALHDIITAGEDAGACKSWEFA